MKGGTLCALMSKALTVAGILCAVTSKSTTLKRLVYYTPYCQKW